MVKVGRRLKWVGSRVLGIVSNPMQSVFLVSGLMGVVGM